MPPGFRRERSAAVELLREQQVRGPCLQRVGDVYDGDVEALVGGIDVSQGVLVQQRQARVVECALVVVRQVLAAHAHHKLVEVNHHHALDGLVPQRLPRGRSLAAARDEYRARVRMRYHRRLHQRLVVHELVKLGGLRLVVQHEAPCRSTRRRG